MTVPHIFSDEIGAIKRRYLDENFAAVSNTIFVPSSGGDDTLALQAAINSFSNGSAGKIVLDGTATYRISTMVALNNRSITLDGQGATILVTANMSYAFNVNANGCLFINFTLNKSVGVVASGFWVQNLRHLFFNIVSGNQIWVDFFYCQNMKESHFMFCRVDNDTSAQTGRIWHIDYSVNNSISNCFVGFCSEGIFISNLQEPTFFYHSEGLTVDDTYIVFAKKAVNCDWITLLQMSDCTLDFCETWGVFCTNGSDLIMEGVWIAGNVTNGFLGIGASATFPRANIKGVTINRGATVITGNGFSIAGPNSLVACNSVVNFNGGVVTDATSQVYGNTQVGGTRIASATAQTEVDGILRVNGTVDFNGAVSGSATAGGVAAVPATVAGFLTVSIGGTTRKMPYFAV